MLTFHRLLSDSELRRNCITYKKQSGRCQGKPGFTLRSENQVISNTGFESPCLTKGESYRFSPLETPSALCPPQEAGFTLNKEDTFSLASLLKSDFPDEIARRFQASSLSLNV